jgi:hypothetical protein
VRDIVVVPVSEQIPVRVDSLEPNRATIKAIGVSLLHDEAHCLIQAHRSSTVEHIPGPAGSEVAHAHSGRFAATMEWILVV